MDEKEKEKRAVEVQDSKVIYFRTGSKMEVWPKLNVWRNVFLENLTVSDISVFYLRLKMMQHLFYLCTSIEK